MELLTRGETGDMDLLVRRSPHLPTPASICKAAVVHAHNGEVLKNIGHCLMLISVFKKVAFYITESYFFPFF